MSSEEPEKIGRKAAIESLIRRLEPGSEVEEIESLAGDSSDDDSTKKAKGYGKPLQVVVRRQDGKRQSYVFHTAQADEFGHSRRSDRAEELILAYDTFASIPCHVRALDVGAVDLDGHLTSLRTSSEFYLLTEFRKGREYVEDLRRIAANRAATGKDLERCEALAKYLAELHTRKLSSVAGYRRAIRNLAGDGEGIFGMIDGFPPDTPSAPEGRLQQIERQCAEWRWVLRGREHRYTTVHGDFHPFNILFDEEDRISLLDASRGCDGDAADDTTSLAINYLLFGLEHPDAWSEGFRKLWKLFWNTYSSVTDDQELFEVAPPFFAWRALVVTNPKWYPQMTRETRDALLQIVERSLAEGRLDPRVVERVLG